MIKCPVCDDEERHQYDNEPIKEHDEAYHELLERINKLIKEFDGIESYTYQYVTDKLKSLLRDRE